MDVKQYDDWFAHALLERFLRYVRIDTTSDRHNPNIPSSPGQLVLAEALVKELAGLGCADAAVDGHGCVFARLPGDSARPPIALIAHLDTSAEAPGKNVRPRVHEKYDGKPIRLAPGVVVDPAASPDLLASVGQTIVTSSGDTLLGADDKAGVAAIVTAVEFLTLHPEARRGDIEIVFTPDEETGRGTDHFPRDKMKAKAAVTVDGSGDGIVEAECFEAYKAIVAVTGKSFHPGESRGRLVNAVEIAAEFVCRIPKTESPQATDGRFGFYAPMEIRGTVEEAVVECIIRDFDDAQCRRRIAALRSLAASLQRLHPGARLTVKAVKQYANMKPWIEASGSPVVSVLLAAIRKAGIEPAVKSIRGGTDGARLSEKGLPCPNLFNGGHDYHSRAEWVALPAMVRSSLTLVYFAELWAATDASTLTGGHGGTEKRGEHGGGKRRGREDHEERKKGTKGEKRAKKKGK